TYREDADHARDKPEATHHQREDDPRDVMRDQVDRYAEDHRADVLGGGRLEEICAAAGAVADIVADQVRDDGRVGRVVLGNAGVDLSHQVGAEVRGLRVDPAGERR